MWYCLLVVLKSLFLLLNLSKISLLAIVSQRFTNPLRSFETSLKFLIEVELRQDNERHLDIVFPLFSRFLVLQSVWSTDCTNIRCKVVVSCKV
jgi:hypothetical protein